MPVYKHSKEISDLLAKLRRKEPQVLMAAVISQDGVLLGTDLAPEFKQDRFSLLSASIISLAGRASVSLDLGNPEQICLMCKSGIIVLTSLYGKGTLCVITTSGGRLGSVLFEMRRISEELTTYIYPVNYGTAFLDPNTLEQYEKDHGPGAPANQLPPTSPLGKDNDHAVRSIPQMHTAFFLRQPGTPDTSPLNKDKK